MLNCVCKTQITTLSPCDRSQKKTVLFSAEQAYKYLHSRPHYLSNCRWGAEKGAGGERPARDQTSKHFVWTFGSIRAASPDWACQVSHTCAPVGFRFPLPGVSAWCAPGFLFMLLLEDCWYEVSQSLWHPRSLVQHVQVVSHLHVREKSKVEGPFHILINPAADRRFIYVKPVAWPCSPLSLFLTFYTPSPYLLTLCLSLLFLVGLRDTNQKCKHLSWCNTFCACRCTHTHTYTSIHPHAQVGQLTGSHMGCAPKVSIILPM